MSVEKKRTPVEDRLRSLEDGWMCLDERRKPVEDRWRSVHESERKTVTRERVVNVSYFVFIFLPTFSIRFFCSVVMSMSIRSLNVDAKAGIRRKSEPKDNLSLRRRPRSLQVTASQ